MRINDTDKPKSSPNRERDEIVSPVSGSAKFSNIYENVPTVARSIKTQRCTCVRQLQLIIFL